jgi:K+-transporting ATPase ATPase B chain
MYGDGTNDAPALAQANLAVVMNSGTLAAKEACDLVDMDSDPTKFLEIAETARQMLTRRRSLATFSMAADLSKYILILPVVFAATYPAVNALNFSRLASPSRAILSAVIFNIVVIFLLLLLAVPGLEARASSDPRRLQHRLWAYGLVGLLLPWIGIKLIDAGLATFRLG